MLASFDRFYGQEEDAACADVADDTANMERCGGRCGGTVKPQCDPHAHAVASTTPPPDHFPEEAKRRSSPSRSKRPVTWGDLGTLVQYFPVGGGGAPAAKQSSPMTVEDESRAEGDPTEELPRPDATCSQAEEAGEVMVGSPVSSAFWDSQWVRLSSMIDDALVDDY